MCVLDGGEKHLEKAGIEPRFSYSASSSSNHCTIALSSEFDTILKDFQKEKLWRAAVYSFGGPVLEGGVENFNSMVASFINSSPSTTGFRTPFIRARGLT